MRWMIAAMNVAMPARMTVTGFQSRRRKSTLSRISVPGRRNRERVCFRGAGSTWHDERERADELGEPIAHVVVGDGWGAVSRLRAVVAERRVARALDLVQLGVAGQQVTRVGDLLGRRQ